MAIVSTLDKKQLQHLIHRAQMMNILDENAFFQLAFSIHTSELLSRTSAPICSSPTAPPQSSSPVQHLPDLPGPPFWSQPSSQPETHPLPGVSKKRKREIPPTVAPSINQTTPTTPMINRGPGAGNSSLHFIQSVYDWSKKPKLEEKPTLAEQPDLKTNLSHSLSGGPTPRRAICCRSIKCYSVTMMQRSRTATISPDG